MLSKKIQYNEERIRETTDLLAQKQTDIARKEEVMRQISCGKRLRAKNLTEQLHETIASLTVIKNERASEERFREEIFRVSGSTNPRQESISSFGDELKLRFENLRKKPST